MPTPLRNIRIDDDLWDGAQAQAEAEGRSVSEVVRELLSQWLNSKKGTH